MSSKLWWGYRHINGGLHLKAWRTSKWGYEAIREARKSPFVDDVFGPFNADTRDDASLTLHQLATDLIAKEKGGLS